MLPHPARPPARSFRKTDSPFGKSSSADDTACRTRLSGNHCLACQPWIIHGFRGKKEVARSLLDQGFYLSFGQKFQPETLRYVPEDRLLLETDESLLPIREIYQEAASTRKTTVEQLEKAVSSTINKLFFSR